MNSAVFSEENKTQEMDDMDIKLENLHHSIYIKEEINESNLDQDEKLCEQFECWVCHVIFTDKLELIEHTQIHTAAKQFSIMTSSTHTFLYACNLCDYRTYEMESLDSHLVTHSSGNSQERLLESNSRKKPFQCKNCDFKCCLKADLIAHLMVHTGLCRFKCNICDLRFFYHIQLRTHYLRIHTGQKPYVCHVCAHKFFDKSVLKSHLQIHIGKKHLECKLCNLKFPRTSDFKCHLNTHTGEQPVKWKITTINVVKAPSIKLIV